MEDTCCLIHNVSHVDLVVSLPAAATAAPDESSSPECITLARPKFSSFYHVSQDLLRTIGGAVEIKAFVAEGLTRRDDAIRTLSDPSPVLGSQANYPIGFDLSKVYVTLFD